MNDGGRAASARVDAPYASLLAESPLLSAASVSAAAALSCPVAALRMCVCMWLLPVAACCLAVHWRARTAVEVTAWHMLHRRHTRHLTPPCVPHLTRDRSIGRYMSLYGVCG